MISPQEDEVESFSWKISRKDQKKYWLTNYIFILSLFLQNDSPADFLGFMESSLKTSRVILVWSSWWEKSPAEWQVCVESSEMSDVPGLCGIILC